MKTITKKLSCLLLVIFLLGTLSACGDTFEKPQTNERDSTQKQIEILNEYINIRAEATTKSETLGKVYKGEIYTVLESDKLWVKIQTSNNITGWIISNYENTLYITYLETNGTIPEEQKTLDKIASGDYLDIDKIPYQRMDWISDVPLSEIKCIKDDSLGIQPKMFITNSGDLYEFSTNKLYTNEQVCKKVDSDTTFDRFHRFANDRGLSIIFSNDGAYYYYEEGEFKDSYQNQRTILTHINSKTTLNYGVDQYSHPHHYHTYYYAIDNQVYQYKLEILSGYENFDIINDSVFDTFPEGETCIAVEGKIFVTDKAFYRIGITNQADVNKYEDVEPIYGLIRMDAISDEYNKIAYFNGNYIIYKDDPNHLYIYR